VSGSLVVVNPNASHVRSADARDRLKRQLDRVLTQRDGVSPSIVETAAPGETEPLTRSWRADGGGSVVAVGGDGTVREVAAGLRGSGVPIGIVPAGTGNQVAAVLGLPKSLPQAVETLATGRATTIDLGEISVQTLDGPQAMTTSVIGCGAGFDAELMATTPSRLKQRFGKWAYLAQAARLALRIKALPYRITIDGRVVETEASIALIGNMGQLLPGLVDLRLPLDPADGQFDVIAVAARGPIHGARGLYDQLRRTQLGGEDGADSMHLRGREVSIELEEPVALEVDGDYVGRGRMLSAQMLPGALEVLVPHT
jgi:diacylglycerol kinase (ATP)